MPGLEFSYASTGPAPLPSSVTKVLSTEWRVSRSLLKSIQTWSSLPDFTWINLGKVGGKDHASLDAIRTLAELQSEAPSSSLIFFSGQTRSTKEHAKIVSLIFSAFPNPANVEIDMAGQPDVLAAIAKFLALRKKTARRPERMATIVEEPKPTVFRILNEDLRSARGNLSIKLIADLFGLEVAELGRLIGKDNRATLSKTPDAPALQTLLTPFSEIAALRLAAPGDDDFRKWLRSPHDQMEKQAPLDWIRQGKAEQVADFVQNALAGQTS